MTRALTLSQPRVALADPRWLALGFVYWLVFLLSLEPDNVMRALRAGAGLAPSQETLRILGASLLGCAATPLLLALVRRFPVEGPRWRRRALLQGLGSVAISAGLIAISCVLADWFLAGEHRSLGVAIGEELIANGPLVAFCCAAFIVLAHAVRSFELSRSERVHPMAQAASYAATIPVRTRGRVTLLDVACIDWIETQGNYLALHVGREAHLIRDSLGRLEARLDPAGFVRVHRRIVVAASRIAAVTSLGAGDGRLLLKDGTQLRLSRTYRDAIDDLVRQTIPGSGGRSAC